MSSLGDFLNRLRALDIRLTLDGERLSISAPKGVLTDALRAELSARKDEVKALLRDAQADGQGDAIPKVPRTANLPVSHTQQRLWFLKQMDPDSIVYNVANAIRIKGPLDVAALERALCDLFARHESLRTRFIMVEGAPRCVIEPEVKLPLVHVDLSRTAAGEREEEAMRVVLQAARETFDLQRAPLVHLMLVRLDAHDHIFCHVFDHIVVDGLSIGIFIAEFQSLYNQYVTGQSVQLPPLVVQYLDYAEWQRRWLAAGALDEHLAYWKKQLSPVSSALQLPTDRPRPKVQTFNGARVLNKFPPELTAGLKGLARSEGATLYMVLLTAFQALLHRYTGDELIAVGSATANRARPEAERIIGFFANNAVLLGDFSGTPTLRQMLARIRDTALKAYTHQDMPFDVLVDVLAPRRELDHSPIYQVMFVLHTLSLTRVELAGLECEAVEVDIGTARFDLSVDVFDLPEGLRVYFEYNTDLFEEETMQRMMGHFQMLLEGCVSNPAARISEIPMLGLEERAKVLHAWNRTHAQYDVQQTLHGLFQAQVSRTPDAEAVRFEDSSLTYAQLDRRSNQLARHLRSLGVGHESYVGICIERSLDMIVALLGVLKAGAAYVPLDPAFPQDRIEFMVQDAGLGIVVTQARLATTLASRVQAVCMDSEWSEIESLSSEPVSSAATSASLAYVIYTSGSTGRPKGVQLEHRSVVNFLVSMHREPGIRAEDRFLSVTTLSFDIAGLEIFGPLTVGGVLVIADRATVLDGHRLINLIEDSQATVMQATPATWRLLLESGWEGNAHLKMLCGGEALPRDLADRLLDAGRELWNMYGPTETTIWSTVAKVQRNERQPHIGRPIDNTQVYVLDAEQQPAPIGIRGELYIAGDGVARGYLNRPDLTAERFVISPFGTADTRMYRTGDLARWRTDGTLECLGRVDQQVKIRGYRIEPGEVEVVLATHPEVVKAAVVARPDASGERRLVAYLVTAGQAGASMEPAALRRFLSGSLPEYMIPSIFVIVAEFPLTPNGKIDRKALPEPESQTVIAGAAYISPQDDTEVAVATIWQEVLKLDRVGRNDNFFDLGGHSLLVVQVRAKLQKQFACNVPLIELFQYPTVAALATHLTSAASDAEEIELARERATKQRAARAPA